MTTLEPTFDASREGLPIPPRVEVTPLPIIDVCRGDCPDCPNRHMATEEVK